MGEVEINQKLEELSEKVRKGCPIGFNEALEVIEYQEKLKQQELSRKRIKSINRKSNLIMFAVVAAVVAFTALALFVRELIFNL